MKAGQAPAGLLAHVPSLRDLDVVEVSRCTTCRGVCVYVTKIAQKMIKWNIWKKKRKGIRFGGFGVFTDFWDYFWTYIRYTVFGTLGFVLVLSFGHIDR